MIDMTYIIFVLPALLLAMWAQAKVSSTFQRYSKILCHKGLTGYDAARKILDDHGLHHIKIEHISGSLTDHYDPKANVIRLSDSVHSKNSIGAVGVAAHEAGHAVQHSEQYLPIKIRNAVIPAANIGSYAAFPLALIGILFSSEWLINAGIILFSAVVFFQLVTLPVEFNASSRAVKVLDDTELLEKQEIRGVKKVLSAAAMTYVAAAATAIMNLVRLLVLTKRNRD